MVGYLIAGVVLLLFQVKVVVAECDVDAARACVTYYPPFPVEVLPTKEECRHFTEGTDIAAVCINRHTRDCGTNGQLEAISLFTNLQLDVEACKIVTDRCYNDSCENNAACMEEETGPFVCLCSHEYTGATCQTKITTAVPVPDPTGSAATSTDAPSSLTLPLAVGVSVSLSVVLAIAVTLAVRWCPTRGPVVETINPAYHVNDRESVISVTDTDYQEINLPDSPDGASSTPTSADLGLANIMPCQDCFNDLGNNSQASHAEDRIGAVV